VARFYAPYFTGDAGRYFSSDYRLGDYGALSLGLELRKRFAAWELVVGAERYRADGGYALGAARSADPAAVRFLRFHAGFDYRFD
jgi:hypothetical protein